MGDSSSSQGMASIISDIVNHPDKWLQYGPLGFAALMFVVVLVFLPFARSSEKLKTIRQVLYISFASFCLSAILAFVPPFIESSKPVLTSEQAQQLIDAVAQNDQAKAAVGSMFFKIQNSCGGGRSGENPGNFGAQKTLSDTANTNLDAVGRALQTALTCTRAR